MDDTQRLDYNDDEEETTLNRDRPAGNLHMFAGIHGPAQDFPIYYGQNIIGRHASCDITLPAQSVSKKHAILQVRGDCHTICDKGSLNKTRRGKVALAPDVHYALSDGDFLLFADVACRYTVLDKVEAETTGVEESEDDSVLIPPTQGALAIEKTPGAAIRRIARGAVLARDSGDEDEEEERPTRRHEGGCGSFKDSFKTSSTGAIFPPDADTIVPESDEEIDTSTSETHLPTLNAPSDSDTDTSRRSSFVPCSQNISTPVVLKDQSKLFGRTLPVVVKEETESGKPSDAEIKLRLAVEDPPDCKKNQEETEESISGMVAAPRVELVGTIDNNVKKEQECEKLVQDDASNKPSSEGIPVSNPCGEDNNVTSSRSETLQEAPSESKPKIDASMQHNNVQLLDTGVETKEDKVSSEMESDISEDATKSGIDVKTAETSEIQNRTGEDSNGGALGSGGAEFHMDSDTDDDEDEAVIAGPDLEKAETHHVPEMKESENNETSVTGGNEGGSDSDTDVEDDLKVIKSKSDDEGNKTKDEPSKSEGSAGFGIDSETDDDDDVDIPKPAESNAEQDSKSNIEEKKEEFHMDSDTDVEEDVSTAEVKETEPESSKESGKETKDVLNLDSDTDVDEEVDVSSRDVTHGPQDSSASTNVKEATGEDSDTDVDEDGQIPGGPNVALEKTSTDEPKAVAKEASALHVDSDTDVDDDDVAPEGPTHADSANTGSDVTKAAELHLDSDTDVEEGDAGEAKVDSSVLENADKDQKSLSSTHETGAVDEISTEETKNLPAQLGTEDDETQKSESESIDLEMMPTQCFLEPQEEESELQDDEEATQAFILSSTWAEPDPFKRPADPIGVLQISSVTLNTSEEEIDENAIAETQAFCSEVEPRGPSLQETPEPVERSVEETVQSSGSGEDSEKEGQQLPHEPISQDATQPVSQCLSGRPPQETGTWVHLKREVPASVWIRGIQQEGDSKDLEGDKETAEDETQAYEQSLNLELEATQSYIDCPSLQRSPLQTDTPAVPTAEEDNAEPDVPSEKIEKPSSEDTQASESDATQPYSPSHTGPGVDSGTTQSSALSEETTGDSATQAESIHPIATEDDETQVVPQSVPVAEEVVPETSTKSKEKISLRRGLSRSKKKQEPAQNIPTSSTVEEKASSTVEEKASSTVEEKTSSTVEEKASSTVEEKTSSTVEEKASSTVEKKASSTVEEKASSTVEEKASSTVEEKASSTTEEKTSLINIEQTSSTVEEKASSTAEEKALMITEEQTSLITKEQTSSTAEENALMITEEQTLLITEELTSSTTEEKTSLITEEQTSSTTEEKASSTTEKQNSLINKEQTTLITEEKTSLITDEKISLITEENTSSITEEQTSTEEPLDKGSAAHCSLKEGQDHQITGKSQPSEPEIKEEQDQKEVRRRGGRRTAASQDKDTAKEKVSVAATSRKETSKIASEAEPSTSGVSEKRGRRQVPRKGAVKEVNEELEEEHKQSSSNAEEIKESSALSVNPTKEIESASSVDDKKSNTVQQISKDSSDQASLENKESLCTESEEPMEAKENSAEKEPDSSQNKKTARNKRKVATRLKNEADKEEDKEENIDHNLKTSQEKDTSKQTLALQTQQEESQGRKATRKSHVKPSDAAEENKKTVEDSQASQVSGNEKSRRTRRSLKEDVKEESEKVQEVKGKARSTSVEDAGLKHEEKGNEDMPENDKRPKRTRKNSKKDTTKPEELREDGKKVTTKPEEVKEDCKTEENESVTKPTRARKNIKEQQKPEDNIEPQEMACSDSQTSRRTRRECRGEDKVVQEETVKQTTSRRTRRHSKEEEAVKSEDQTKKPRRTRKDSKEETTTKETVEESPLDNKKEAAEGNATLKTRKNIKDNEASVNETKQIEKNSKSERSSRTRAKASHESKELNEDVDDVKKGAEESPNASPQEETSKPARGRGRRAAKKEDLSPFSTPVASRKRAKASDESKELNEDVEDINKGAEKSPKVSPQEETSKPARGRGRQAAKKDISPVSTPVASRKRAKASDESKELNEDMKDIKKGAEKSPKVTPQEETSKPARGRGRQAAKKEDISPVSTPVASRKRAKVSDESKELNEDVEDINKGAEESPKVSPQEETSKPAGGRGRRAARALSPVSTPVASRKRGQATKAEVEVKRKKSNEGEDQEETKAVETPKRGRGRPRKEDTQQTPTRKDVTPPDPSPSQNTRQRPSSVLGNSPEPITPRRTNRVSTPAPATRLAQSASSPKILFTGVVDTAGEETIRSLGGDIAKSVFDCTHLVTDRVRRTVKFLCALARGIPIVTLDWIDKCKKSGCFLSSTGFLVHDKEQEKNFNFLLSESLQKAKRSPLFEGYEIHVTANVKPEPDQMKDIISCSGATFLPKMPRTFKEKCVIVSCPEDAARCKSVPASVPITSAEFILSGILRQEVNPTAYLLSPADTVPTPAKRKR